MPLRGEDPARLRPASKGCVDRVNHRPAAHGDWPLIQAIAVLAQRDQTAPPDTRCRRVVTVDQLTV